MNASSHSPHIWTPALQLPQDPSTPSWGSPSHRGTVPSEAGVPVPRSAMRCRGPGAQPVRLP